MSNMPITDFNSSLSGADFNSSALALIFFLMYLQVLTWSVAVAASLHEVQWKSPDYSIHSVSSDGHAYEGERSISVKLVPICYDHAYGFVPPLSSLF
jgi:hypothetical protein